jgi:DNA-binding LacI/PurR family transcriptional regulator
VSLAFQKHNGRGSPSVSPATVLSVILAAEKLGYPLDAADRLPRRAQRRVGVVVPDLEGAHHIEIARQLIRKASERNIAILLEEASNSDPPAERRVAGLFKRLNVDAVVTTSSQISADFVSAMGDAVLLVAMVSEDPRSGGVPDFLPHAIVIEHAEGTYEATKYLIEGLGHRRIAPSPGLAGRSAASPSGMVTSARWPRPDSLRRRASS